MIATAIAITPCPRVRPGLCPDLDLPWLSTDDAGPVYCLHDCTGVHLGTIPLPVTRPTTGPSAPTLYLRRDLQRNGRGRTV